VPDPKASPDDQPEGEEALSEDALDLESLKKRADLVGLLALAKAYRAGSAPGGRDMKKCLESYRAAAELGSAEAEYAVALFYLSGGVVPQDLKEGATRLRAAAEKGSIPARVYLGNMYELGIHYKADPEKADVWYRNAARAAKLDDAPGSEGHAYGLAELGCVRYVLALVETGAVEEEDKTRLLARAKAHGYGLRVRDDAEGERMTFTDALAGAEAAADAASGAPAGGAPAPLEASSPIAPPAPDAKNRERANTAPSTPGAKKKAESTPEPKPKKKSGPGASVGLAAFGYALLFVLTGCGAGYAASLGARELVAHGHLLPGLGARVHLVFPIVLGIVGVLPAWLVYKLSAVVKAILVGGALAGVGWIAWGTGQGAFHGAREVQAIAFGLAGFLAALLVLGLLGGTKRHAAARLSR
jgi:hypothetical protein